MESTVAFYKRRLADGWTLVLARNGHYAVLSPAGRMVRQVSATPSDHRTRDNEVAALRRVGAIVEARPQRREPDLRIKTRAPGMVKRIPETRNELRQWGEGRATGLIGLDDLADRRLRLGFARA